MLCCGCCYLVAESCLTLLWLYSDRLFCPWDFPGKSTGVGRIFFSNPGTKSTSPALAGRFFTTEPLDCKEIQPVHPKGNQSWIFIERTVLKLKLQYFVHLIWRTDSLEKTLILGKIEGGRRRGWQKMRRVGGLTNLMDMSLSMLRGLVMDRDTWRAAVHVVAKSWTRLSYWTELNWATRGAKRML